MKDFKYDDDDAWYLSKMYLLHNTKSVLVMQLMFHLNKATNKPGLFISMDSVAAFT